MTSSNSPSIQGPGSGVGGRRLRRQTPMEISVPSQAEILATWIAIDLATWFPRTPSSLADAQTRRRWQRQQNDRVDPTGGTLPARVAVAVAAEPWLPGD